jgi:uncharacterized protein YjbI with pentapeptide repeats
MVEEKGKQAEERQDEPHLWRPWRPPRRRMGWRVLWAVGMVVAVLTTGLLIVDLRPEIWKDLLEGRVLTLVALGFSLTAIIVMLAIAGARRSWTGFQGKTVWDFLQLLIVPLMLVAIGLVFALQQDARQQRIENQRAAAERELAEQRAQDEALQTYLDQMSSLMLERNLSAYAKDSPVRKLARARTLTILERLDKGRKSSVMAFLIEASLIQKVDTRPPVISLEEANLKGTAFGVENGFSLSSRNALSEALIAQEALARDPESADADLHGANLSFANLRRADLFIEDLRSTTLFDADLSGTDLRGANLSGTNLKIAKLHSVKLQGATFTSDTSFVGADLSGANLSDVTGITNEQLCQQAPDSLEGTTMPNGKKYKDGYKGCVGAMGTMGRTTVVLHNG